MLPDLGWDLQPYTTVNRTEWTQEFSAGAGAASTQATRRGKKHQAELPHARDAAAAIMCWEEMWANPSGTLRVH
jgi:hypothetical protein